MSHPKNSSTSQLQYHLNHKHLKTKVSVEKTDKLADLSDGEFVDKDAQ